MSKITEIKIRETLEFKISGARFRVLIDYLEERVSFVDENHFPMNFVFSNRGTEHLGGWIKIFKALEEVTRIADQKLREHQAQKSDELLDLMMEWTDIADRQSKEVEKLKKSKTK